MSIQSEISRIKAAIESGYQAVRAKGGTVPATANADNLGPAIMTIPEGEEPKEIEMPGYPYSAAKSADILYPKYAYTMDGDLLKGTITSKGSSDLTVNGASVSVPAGYYPSTVSKSVATATQATPSITVDSNGEITAEATQSAGYVAAGTKKATKQLSTQAAQTITPGTTDKTIASGKYLTGTQTIKGDANLKTENIKSGVTIFGVTGTLKEGSSGTDTSDATAVADDILSGKTAYVKGSKVTGTITSRGSSDLTASGGAVGVPAGYYPSTVSKSVATATQATPSIDVDSDGKITAEATQSAGYVAAGTKKATKQLSTQAAQTITPGTTDKTIASGKYLTGTQTIKGDANLKAGNIKSGVTIFGVTGTAQTGASTNSNVEVSNKTGVTIKVVYYEMGSGSAKSIAIRDNSVVTIKAVGGFAISTENSNSVGLGSLYYSLNLSGAIEMNGVGELQGGIDFLIAPILDEASVIIRSSPNPSM